MTKELKQEYTFRISQANKSELVVIIYEMLLDYIKDARHALAKDDLQEFHESIRRATGCIRELTASINFDMDTSGNLLSLYIYCTKELSKADLHHTADELYHVELVMNKLHAAFHEVAGKNPSAPVMNNSQVVYAGLTYGKESLVIHINDNNRGIKA